MEMSGTDASTFKSANHSKNLYVDPEHIYEDTIDVVKPNRTTNKQLDLTQKTVKRCGLPLTLAGINTALICVIIAAAVYLTWISYTETKIIESIRQKQDEVNPKFQFECKNTHEWKRVFLFRCETNWRLYEGYCYYFGHQKKAFDDAQNICAFLNGSLVKIEDEDEDYWLKRYITADTWIGGNKTDIGRNYTWLDGTPLVYNGWQENEPSNNGFCVQYWYSRGKYAWDDDRCMFAKSFVCEKNAQRINFII